MELKIISGTFEPGEKVTVSFDGKEVTRRVFYSLMSPYINFKGDFFYLYEFENGYTEDYSFNRI